MMQGSDERARASESSHPGEPTLDRRQISHSMRKIDDGFGTHSWNAIHSGFESSARLSVRWKPADLVLSGGDDDTDRLSDDLDIDKHEP